MEASWPQSPDHARQLAKSAVADSYDVVAAMGGDGVAHHVGHTLAGTDTALGLIPTGTTNVYARLLAVPEKPVPAARLLAGENQTVSAPLLSIDGQGTDSQLRHHALFAAGFGFDADVVRAAELEPYRKYRFGGIHYARTAIGTLVAEYRNRRPHSKVRVGGEVTEAVAVLIQFHPVYTYFGRLKLSIAPTPAGTLTVLTMEALPARRLPRIGAALLRGADLSRIPGFRVWPVVEEVHIESTPAISGQADGELTGPWTEARATLRPHSLRVIIPPE